MLNLPSKDETMTCNEPDHTHPGRYCALDLPHLAGRHLYLKRPPFRQRYPIAYGILIGYLSLMTVLASVIVILIAVTA
jgi:hypothetical protein